MLPALPPQLPLFVWHEYPPGRTPRYIELNLRLARRLAPIYLVHEICQRSATEHIDMDADDRVTEEEWSSACARNPVVRACLNRFCRRDSAFRGTVRSSAAGAHRPTRPSGVRKGVGKSRRIT